MSSTQPNRKMSNYLLLTHNGRGNMKYSARGRKGESRRPPPTIFHKMRDFLENNILAWFFHTWHIKKRCPYPAAAGDSIHTLKNSPGNSFIQLCIAADWATGTPQSVFVGGCIGDHDPDYTIHMGDTYYSGADDEHVENFGAGGKDDFGAWPRGRFGSFALTGNHEMFSSGAAYMNMIQDPERGFGPRLTNGKFAGQPAPFVCLRTEHWCILCLDTGYDSLHQEWWRRFFNPHPNNKDLSFPPMMQRWLEDIVDIRNEHRGLVLLTHHQYITGFTDEEEFQQPAHYLRSLLPGREIIWINGHEHRFAMYRKYQPSPSDVAAWVRCIGNGGMVDEHLPKRQVDPARADRGLEWYDNRVADVFHFDLRESLKVGYNGYAQLTIHDKALEITYWAAYWNGEPRNLKYHDKIITEFWRADNATGIISRLGFVDHTIKDGRSGLEHL